MKRILGTNRGLDLRLALSVKRNFQNVSMHHHHWPSKDVQYAQITVIRSTNSSGIGICVYGMCVY